MPTPAVEFSAVLEVVGNADYHEHIIAFPYNAEQVFGLKQGKYRIVITIHGKSNRRALLSDGNGSHYVMIGNSLRKQWGLHAGQRFPVRIELDPHPDAVDVPEELAAGLELEPAAQAAFLRLTPGKQRGICYQVESAKTEHTRAKRAALMLERLLQGFYEKPGTR
jgi:hypothetical protein